MRACVCVQAPYWFYFSGEPRLAQPVIRHQSPDSAMFLTEGSQDRSPKGFESGVVFKQGTEACLAGPLAQNHASSQ